MYDGHEPTQDETIDIIKDILLENIEYTSQRLLEILVRIDTLEDIVLKETIFERELLTLILNDCYKDKDRVIEHCKEADEKAAKRLKKFKDEKIRIWQERIGEHYELQ